MLFCESAFSCLYVNCVRSNVGNNKLQSVPTMDALTNLLELNLKSNLLASLPPALTTLTSLTALYLNDNNIVDKLDTIGQLTMLQHLYVCLCLCLCLSDRRFVA